MGDRIELSRMEAARDSHWTATGRYALQFTRSGNLELWNVPARRRLWESGTDGRGAKLAMQDDGNLVIYDDSQRPLWDTGTAGHRGARLALHADGNVAIYSWDDRVIWQTATREQ